MASCPWCSGSIEDCDIGVSEHFNGDGFTMPCPHCTRMIGVEVEIVEVQYDLFRADEPLPFTDANPDGLQGAIDDLIRECGEQE